MTAIIRHIATVALSALSLSAVLLPSVTLTTMGCGGCPWIDHSMVVVTPERSCLQLSLGDGDGDFPSTGCVNPVLFGENLCGEALVLPATHAMNGVEMRVEDGAMFTYEMDLGACEVEGDGYYAGIPATLGGADILIEFDLYAP